MFHENEDIAWIAKIDKRYAWLKRHLLDFEEKLGKIFPVDWEVSERITVQFCIITRESLKAIMQRRRPEIDVKLLLFAISKTQQFELLLAKRFTGETFDHKISSPHQINIAQSDSLPSISTGSTGSDGNAMASERETIQSPFVDLIGECFKSFLDIYTDSVDRNLAEIMERFVQESLTTKIDPIANNSAVLPRLVCYNNIVLWGTT